MAAELAAWFAAELLFAELELLAEFALFEAFDDALFAALELEALLLFAAWFADAFCDAPEDFTFAACDALLADDESVAEAFWLALFEADEAWLAEAVRLALEDCALLRVLLVSFVAPTLSVLLADFEAELTELVFRDPSKLDELELFFCTFEFVVLSSWLFWPRRKPDNVELVVVPDWSMALP